MNPDRIAIISTACLLLLKAFSIGGGSKFIGDWNLHDIDVCFYVPFGNDHYC